MNNRNVAVEIDSLSFAYAGAHKSIDDISFRVPQGECHVLMGASGSGKTTIIRCINGLAGGYWAGASQGIIRINGIDARQLAAWERAEYVGSVFQDPASQFFSAQLAGEIAFGCENLGFSHEDVVSKVDTLIRNMELENLRGRKIDTLSSGEKQKTAIASALAPSPKILVMDEPSANLDENAARELGQTLKRLKEQGVTLLIAEHRIGYLMDVADSFHYVHEGRKVCTMRPDDVRRLTQSERLEMGIRTSDMTKNMEEVVQHKSSVDGASGHNVELKASHVTVRIDKDDIVCDASLDLCSGNITAIIGENGVGKTTFMRALAGLVKTQSGSICIDGRNVKPRHLRKKVWYSPNDLSAQFFTASVAEEVMLQVIPTEDNVEKARELLKKLGLYEYKESHPYALSGGQKQRLAVVCALMQERKVIIFDEPTSGLDAINMLRLSDALTLAAQNGAAIAVVTHDSDFIEACCTHAYVMNKKAK
ncbi:MAG: ABC transporter ATP-binding protein [Actinomycetaceae bacterium]|nr:ABC transporter ATP-binding protein [Actinomycetaceae bacterium]